jgi:rod shape-determining protein MreD
MRWPTVILLGYLAIGVQLGSGEYLRVGDARPDLVLLVVIFIAINAPRESALLACFAFGLVQDFVTISPIGLYALSYSLVGMFVVSTQELVYRAHPVTHVTLGFVGTLLWAAVVLVHGWIRGPRVAVTDLLATALYTAVAAPIVLGALNLCRRPFAFSPRKRVRTI